MPQTAASFAPTVHAMPMLRGPVLVGTDLARGAEEALRQGATFATGLDSRMLVCHVMPDRLRVGMLFPQWRDVDPALVQSMTARARDAVRRELASVFGGQDHETEIVLESGAAAAGLLSQTTNTGAGLIVVGPGAVATQLVWYGTVPVLVARPSPPGAVVGATDLSDPSLHTLRVAAAEARRRKAPLHLVSVLDIDLYMSGTAPRKARPNLHGLSGIALDGLDELEAAVRGQLEDVLREFGLEGQTAVVSGHADRAIVQYAERVGAGLVVVGRHARRGFARLSLGSTATDVFDAAPCSVLVVGA